MILYETDHSNLPKLNITTYNINHGNDYDNSNNSILRTTLHELIFTSTIPNLVFLQECTQDVLDYLITLEEENKDLIVLNSKKIINGNVKIYEKYEYFIFILYSPVSELKITNINNSTSSINIMEVLSQKEKSILINDNRDNGLIYRKLLDSKRISIQNIALKFTYKGNTRVIDFYNVHITSKPNLNYLHSHILNKYLMPSNNHNKVILGDFNNIFNSYSINVLKENKQQGMVVRSKSSKLRNINKVISNDLKFSNVTDFVYSNEIHKEYCKKCIDHILFEDAMKLLAYENNMDVDYSNMKPSDHYYIKTTFELNI
ncbi:hypothetical protein FOG48_02818 [Hanseniaspora uvarum]|nr:hypothetical protein FOG48_02818 [Hanseniaspora uvarum]